MPVSKNVKMRKNDSAKREKWEKKRNGQAKARFSKEKSARSAGSKCMAPASSAVERCRPVVDLRRGLRCRSRCHDRDGRPGRPGAFMRESETEHCTVGRNRAVLSQAMRGRVSRTRNVVSTTGRSTSSFSVKYQASCQIDVFLILL